VFWLHEDKAMGSIIFKYVSIKRMKACTNTKSHGGIALQTKVLDPNAFEFYSSSCQTNSYSAIYDNNF